jgi:hypothetical protein
MAPRIRAIRGECRGADSAGPFRTSFEDDRDTSAAVSSAKAFITGFNLKESRIAAEPPLLVAMRSMISPGHMDVDQFALARLAEDHREGVAVPFDRR